MEFFDAEEVNYRTMRVAPGGKLRGSRARALGLALEGLSAEGYDRIVLDLAGCASVDSVGTLALRAALDLGQRLFVVLDPLRDVLPPEIASDRGVRLFGDLVDAVHHVRSFDESGVLVP